MCHKKCRSLSIFIMIRINYILRFINKYTFGSLFFQPVFNKSSPSFFMMAWRRNLTKCPEQFFHFFLIFLYKCLQLFCYHFPSSFHSAQCNSFCKVILNKWISNCDWKDTDYCNRHTHCGGRQTCNVRCLSYCNVR